MIKIEIHSFDVSEAGFPRVFLNVLVVQKPDLHASNIRDFDDVYSTNRRHSEIKGVWKRTPEDLSGHSCCFSALLGTNPCRFMRRILVFHRASVS
jgi:hypothetical protein